MYNQATCFNQHSHRGLVSRENTVNSAVMAVCTGISEIFFKPCRMSGATVIYGEASQHMHTDESP